MSEATNGDTSAEDLAKRALAGYLIEHPGSSPTQTLDWFFPPSPLGFTRSDLRLAMIDALYYGHIVRDDGGLHLAAASGSTAVPE